MEFLKKLEEFKVSGMYEVCMYYGENIGCDDLDIPMMDRGLKIMACPVGCLGTAKVFFKGTVTEFLNFDLNTIPKKLNNPPEISDLDDHGYYIWGTADGVETILNKKDN